MATKDDTKRVVPWFSKEEWTKVFSLVFSEDIEGKKQGLKRILVWKSRVEKLPLGVECSLYLLQAILQDQDFNENLMSSVTENDISLMYSTAIIRFINLISHLGQVVIRHQPISSIAEMVGIPDWLVSIRHEATHAKMPSLGILRPGAKLAMEWLEENYWCVEEKDSFDLYWPESKLGMARLLRASKKPLLIEKPKPVNDPPPQKSTKLAAIPDELQSAVSMMVTLLKEFQPGRQWTTELKSEELRLYANKLWLKIEKNVDMETHVETDMEPKLKVKNRKRSKSKIKAVPKAPARIALTKIKHLLLHEIMRMLAEWAANNSERIRNVDRKRDVDIFMGKSLVSALCQSPELLGNSSGETRFVDLTLIWRITNRFRSIPLFIEKLTLRDVQEEKERATRLRLIYDFADALLQARDHPSTTNIIKFPPGMEFWSWKPTIRFLLQEPTNETWDAVSKYISLEDPLDEETSTKIKELLDAYLANDSVGANKSVYSTQIYTVEMLAPVNKKIKMDDQLGVVKLKRKEISPSLPPKIDVWTLCTEHDWSKIPIGGLPDNGLNELELKSTHWDRVEPVFDDSSSDGAENKKRTGDRFDWNSLPRQRRRRGGLALTKDAVADI